MIGIKRIVVLGFLIVAGGLAFLPAAAAQDAQGCEGLAAYREAMLASGSAYVEALEEDGILADRDPLTYSSADWDSVAENAAGWQEALKSIGAPDWASNWHQSQIERAGLQEQMGIAAAESGVMATQVFEDSIDANETAAGAAAEAAIQQCTLFLPFEVEWETLGAAIGGAPEAASTGRESDVMAGVMTYDYVCCEHSSETVAYTESPPVGGVHDPAWQTCGFYDAPVRNENAVHSLEHGVVWITYLPDLPANQVVLLQVLAGTDDYLLVSPYQDQQAPIVATAWNNQLEIESASDPALAEFIGNFLQGPQTPEFGAACAGGTTGTVE